MAEWIAHYWTFIGFCALCGAILGYIGTPQERERDEP